jgi:hypothetical protein
MTKTLTAEQLEARRMLDAAIGYLFASKNADERTTQHAVSILSLSSQSIQGQVRW